MASKTLKVGLDRAGRVLPSLDAALAKNLAPGAQALLHAIVAEADRQSGPLYLVGGFVRDLLLGRPNLDLDLVFEGPAIRLGRELQRIFGGELQTHTDFGTAVWWLPTGSRALARSLGLKSNAADAAVFPPFVDLISARGESYAQPAALPSVRFADLSADQYRRDFTINTLAIGLNGLLTGQLIDAWRGLPDLKAGVLRTLHELSFEDDPTRIFRLFRFAGRLDFRIERATAAQMKAALRGIKLLSGERIFNELEKILAEPNAPAILRSLQRAGALKQINPALVFPEAVSALFKKARLVPAAFWELSPEAHARLPFVLWLMHLPFAKVELIVERLRFDKELATAALAAARLRPTLSALRKVSASELTARLEKQPLLAVYALYLCEPSSATRKTLLTFASKLRFVQPRTTGETLQHRGLKPGPMYKTILDALRAAWLDGKVTTTKQEQALLKKLLDEYD